MSVNRMKKRILLLLLVIPALIKAQDVMTETRQELTSPDGAYRFTFYQRAVGEDNTQMYYTLTYKNRPVIEESKLGVLIENQLFESALGIPNDTCHFWCENLKLTGTEHQKTDEIWKPVYGERAEVRDCYNEMTLKFKKGEGKGNQDGGYDKRKNYFMNIIVRAYNEGVAFRYHFLEMTNGLFLHIVGEQTSFTMPEGTMAYYERWAQGPYELRPLKGWGKEESERPLTLKLPDGLSVALLEAEMVDYVRGKFRLSAEKPSTLETSLYSSVDIISPYSTPWRVIMCADKPGEILEHNDILLNLNPPCRIKDTSWIKPGKVMREVTLTTEGGKALVDFAVKRNLQYIHFDAGWYGFEYDKASDATTVTLDPRRNPKIDALKLKEVVAYAKQHGIGVMLYVNQRALQQQLDEILPLYKSWGISGIKFGFVQVGSQVWTKWMHEAVKKCADYGLMVDIHDEYRPTGFSRTYPNLMTQEGIRGNEEFPDATHNVTLPFTRFVAGAADYTICYYRQDFGRLNVEKDNYGVPRSKSIQTTPAHQLALAAVYYSPLQYMYWYDKPSDSQDEPELKFFDDVYTTWDDTKVLQGEVGEFITVARRRGEEWFIGSITNNEARTLPVDLSFLPAGKDYVAEIYTDGDKSIPTRTKVRVSKFRVNAKTVLHFNLRASGGSAIRLVPEVTKDKSLKTYKQQKL